MYDFTWDSWHDDDWLAIEVAIEEDQERKAAKLSAADIEARRQDILRRVAALSKEVVA